MARIQVKTLDDITARKGALQTRFQNQHKVMRDLDPWRHLQLDRLKDEVWQGVPENVQRKPIIKPDIAAVTTTVVAFLAGKEPNITVTPKNPDQVKQSAAANAFERLGAAIWHTLDKYRDEPLLSELTESCVHRGVCVTKVLWLSPEERGEKREKIPLEGLNAIAPLPSDQYDEAGNLVEEQVVEPGSFPILVQPLDPLECFWVTGRDGRTTEFLHVYQATWGELLDNYPDLADRKEFQSNITVANLDVTVECVDYWDETNNAIVIAGKLYKAPTPHHYGCIPIVIDQAKPRKVPYGGSTSTTYSYYQREGTPFCAPMLEPIRNLSWATSVMASYMLEIGYAVLVHRGIKSDGNSPHMVTLTEGPDAGKKVYRFAVDVGPGARVVPLFDQETLEYQRPPDIVPIWEAFKQVMSRDAQLTSFAEGMLTGVMPAGPSGVSVSQQRIATIARMKAYQLTVDRHASRVLDTVRKVASENWDLGDAPLILGDLIGADDAPELQLTKELLDMIAIIAVEIQPEVPTDEEQKYAQIFQAVSLELISHKSAIEQLGLAKDGSAELERIAFEKLALQDPQYIQALARKYAQRAGYIQDQQPVPQTLQQNAPPLPLTPPGGGPPAPVPSPQQVPSAPPAPVPGPVAPGGAPGQGPMGMMGQGQPMNPAMLRMMNGMGQ